MTTTQTDKIKKTRTSPNGAISERTLELHHTEVLPVIVGEQDSNLRTIEKRLEVKIGRVAGGLAIQGEESDVELAFDLLRQLGELISAGEKIFPGDVERSLSLLSSNRRLKLKDFYRDKISIAGREHSIVPKTPLQQSYLEAIQRNDIVFGVGPAGTGKTYLAMAMAVSALLSKNVKRVVLCRPAVEAGEKLGFLPGDMAEKVNPYLRPLYDALHDMVDYDKAKEMVERGTIEVAPLAFMRGRTLSNAFVILDEAQNTTPSQMKMLLTRLGPDSKCVITGDITQIDLPRGQRSGLKDALRILKNVPGISFIEFTRKDVIRHKLVSRIVEAYQKAGEVEDL